MRHVESPLGDRCQRRLAIENASRNRGEAVRRSDLNDRASELVPPCEPGVQVARREQALHRLPRIEPVESPACKPREHIEAELPFSAIGEEEQSPLASFVLDQRLADGENRRTGDDLDALTGYPE